jgi:16S rRNA (cytosine1402-N4)-methyltransferase
LRDFGDEPEAEHLAAALVAARQRSLLQRTSDVARVILEASPQESARAGQKAWRLHPAPHQWNLHPAARTFQALRILVNRELANLAQLLRVLPTCLRPGGRAALLSFHSGEDRLVKAAFRDSFRAGLYARISPEPVRPSWTERNANPRARSAKLRWAQRAG